MKYLWVLLGLNVSLIFGAVAQEQKSVMVSYNSAVHYQRVHHAGQPSPTDFAGLKEKGFDVIINIRGQDEMKFDEKAAVLKNNMAYFNVPVMGGGGIQSPAVATIDQILKNHKGKKILVHCASGNRVGAWFGASLARSGTNIETAIIEAKKAGMRSAKLEEYLRQYHASLTQ